MGLSPLLLSPRALTDGLRLRTLPRDRRLRMQSPRTRYETLCSSAPMVTGVRSTLGWTAALATLPSQAGSRRCNTCHTVAECVHSAAASTSGGPLGMELPTQRGCSFHRMAAFRDYGWCGSHGGIGTRCERLLRVQLPGSSRATSISSSSIVILNESQLFSASEGAWPTPELEFSSSHPASPMSTC